MVIIGNVIFANGMMNVSEGLFPVKVNGIKRSMDTVNVNDRMYVSIRDFCDIIGLDINWNDTEKTIEIVSPNDYLIKENLGIPIPTNVDETTAIKIANALFEQYISPENLSSYELSVSEDPNGNYYKIYKYPKATFGGQMGVLISKKDGKILGFGFGD